jgi:hypothetical protein
MTDVEQFEVLSRVYSNSLLASCVTGPLFIITCGPLIACSLNLRGSWTKDRNYSSELVEMSDTVGPPVARYPLF